MSTVLRHSDWLTVREVADQMAVTEGRVRQWLLAGILKGEKFGHVWAVQRGELSRFAKRDRPPGNPNFRKSHSHS